MPAPKLTGDQKRFIVQQFALFERPVEIAAAVKETYGVDISLQALAWFAPNVNGEVPRKWQKFFDETRAKFREQVSDIPIANKAFRLRELQKLLEKQKSNKLQNPVEIRNTLELAAKESEGHYSNRRELTGKGGERLVPENAGQVVVYLPDNGRGDAGG